MAPGLNGRQTGTVPKKKSRGCIPQSQRLTCEPFIHSFFLELEHMSEVEQKNQSKKNSSTSYSEIEADTLRHELGRSRSSTMSSMNGNREGCSQEGFSNKINVPDRKQVANKLSQIQSYIQQTAALMNTLKSSDSPFSQNQYKKLSVMLEELKDSEIKLSALLSNMNSMEFRLDSLLLDIEEIKGHSSAEVEAEEEELARRSRESKKKLEVLQKRKQDLLALQEKAKIQLQKAQAEQSRLVARASSLNQELSASKLMDLNVQQLNQRLKAVQEMYSTRNQISDNLNERATKIKTRQPEEDKTEMSDTETDLQLGGDKMEELDAMKAQLGQIQKIMASINLIQNSDNMPQISKSKDEDNEQENHSSQNSSFAEGLQNGEDGNNLMKLEQAKSKLNHLTQLLEIVQSAQNAPGLSPSYLQVVSNLMNEEACSFPESPSPTSSIKSPQKNSEEISIQTMKVMTKELEETTAAMKEERDRLLATRQELQDIAKKFPINKSEVEDLSPDYDSESRPPCLKPATLEEFQRCNINELTEAEQSTNCNENSPYVTKPAQNRNKQCEMWNLPSLASDCTTQEKRSKNESVSRASNQSSRGDSHVLGRDHLQCCPSPSTSCCNERPSALRESQQQLELTGNLCKIMLSESLQTEIRPNEISLQDMFGQHQLLTRTIAQCSQILWLQQKQIIELRNAFMLHCRSFSNQSLQSTFPNQSQLNVPPTGNPLIIGTPSLNARQIPPFTIQQQQNFAHSLYQNMKLNAGDIQTIQPLQDFPERFLSSGNQTSLHFPDSFGCDIRLENFNRFNPSGSNITHNFHQNISSGFNNRGPSGMSSVVPEDSGALNNQVPPGNRANNYWDNFRSYSRQNLLSNTKSNEDFEQSRRCSATFSQDRSPRDLVPTSLQNNQSTGGTSQQLSFTQGNCELVSNDQFLLPPCQNTRSSHPSQIMRSCPTEVQSQRNPGKNESKHHDNESRNLNAGLKNESPGTGRSRNCDSGADIRSVRNDVSQSFRNADNLNSSRNFMQLVRDIDNEEIAHENNKKRLERSRSRNDGLGNLNNRGYHNSSLWENVYSEVSNFIRANESRPHFLLQLFRDLQNVTTDNLRQRTLHTIQETVTANNLTERTSNMSGGNVNIIENRNNIRESRSNLNRNQTEDPTRIDELFCHLRENQNTIRQNIGMSNYLMGGNLENPNISNIRELGSSRNNLESEDLRDLRTYYEANLCNFGHNSTLENPNLSNIRENLTRRGISDLENVHPKNVYLSIYDNASELRRRNQDSSGGHQFLTPFRNFELENNYLENEISENCENLRECNTHFELENNFEGAVGGRVHFQEENRPMSSEFSVLDAGRNFGRSRQFPDRQFLNGNDSGIDINFNNDERKRSLAEGDANVNEGTIKAKKSAVGNADGAGGVVLRGEWERNGGRDGSFDSSISHSRKEMTSFIPMCDNSLFHCRAFQQTDNGDLAEADQSRNEETSGAESDNGFINTQIVDSGILFSPDRNHQTTVDDFSSQNVPEAERNFPECKSCESDCNINDFCGAKLEGNPNFSNSASKSETNVPRGNDGENAFRKSDALEGFYYQMNPSTTSEGAVPKSGVKHRKRADETAERETSGDVKKISSKNSTNKFRDSSFSQGRYNCTVVEEAESRKADPDSAASAVEGKQLSEGRDSFYYGTFQLALENDTEIEKRNKSPEAESDWESGSGLDQVPTRLKKNGPSKKSEDSGDSVP